MKINPSRHSAAILWFTAAVSLFAPTTFAKSGTTAATATPGYDVVLLIGQSNMVGVGTGVDDAGDAAVDSRIFQWQPYTNTIIPALDPIYQNQALDYVGLPLTFAKAYAKTMAPGRQLLLVGAATGSMGFSNGYWLEPSGTGVTTALSWVNAAMAGAGPNARLVGILWHQGEEDIIDNGGAAYATNLANLIAYMRANVTGATSTTPFVIGEHTYAWLTSNLTTASYVTQQDLVLNADHTLPDSVPYTAWTSSAELPADATYGPAHFSALSYRQFGRRYADKFFEALNNLPQPQVSQKWWAGTFYDDGRGLGSANTNTIPVNNPPAVSGTVSAAIDQVRGNVAQITQGQGWLNFQVPSATFNGSYSKMAWFLPGATGYTNNLISASNSGQVHFLSAQTLSATTLLIAAGHSTGSLTPIVQAQITNPAGTWINVAVTYDSVAQVMTLYVNGVVVSSQSKVAPAPAASTSTTLQSLLSGSIGATGTTGLDGEMAGNRAWTSTLTAAQIATIYNYELPGTANQPGFGIVAGVPSQWSLYSVPYQQPSLSIAATSGSTASMPVTVVPNNGFTGAVTLSVAGLPSGLTATLAAGKTANAYTLQLSEGSSVTAGTYPLSIIGTSANNISAQAALALTVVNTAGEIPVNLSSSFNHQDTVTTDGTSFSNGSADGAGYAYSATLLGTTLTTPNGQFTIGAPNTANSVANASIALPSGNFSSISLLGAGFDTATGQTFTVTYSDGTTSVFTQSISNWCTPQQYTGETIAIALPYRNYYNGTQQNLNCFLYSYSFPLNAGKIAQSITLPGNTGVLILAVTVTGQLSAAQSFALTAAPASLTVIPGNSAASTISVAAINGFSGTVSLSASGLPTGVTASFTAGSVAGTTLLALTTGSTAAAGTSTVTITGVSGSLTVATTISLTVTKPNVTPVSLTSAFNLYGIVNSGATPTNGGLDTSNYDYSANLLGASLVFQGIPYSFGAAGTANAAASTTLTLTPGKYTTLNLLGAGVYGAQQSQTFTVTYTDGTTSAFTQSMSDWGAPQSYTGETIALTMAARITPTGTQQAGPWYVYAYSFALNNAKTVKSLTLPSNRDATIVAVTLSGSASLTAQTITFNTVAAQTVGTTLSLTATATSTLAVTYASSTTTICTVSGSTATFLAAGTCTITASQAGNTTYAAATPVTQSFTVTAALKPQTITFGTISAQKVGTPLTLTATASSTLAVTYASSTTTICTVSGSTATFLATGTCTITASQPGNTSYAAATPLTQSFTVTGTLKTQTITFGTISAQKVGTPLTLTATASSTLAVTYASSTTTICTVSGSTATFLAAGTCTITASQPGNTAYAAATPVTQSFTVTGTLKTQTITFGTISAQKVGTPLTLTATASSTLVVTYTSSTTTICTVSTSTATFLAAGTCTITASQSGNVTYSAATPVVQSFTVQAVATSTTTGVSLASAANIYGIFNNGSTVTNGGLDTSNYAYSSTLLGTTLTFQSMPYTFGTPGAANALSSATLALPSGNYTTLGFLGAAVFGSQASQSFVVTYIDGTTTTFTQGISDWGASQAYTGESIALTMSYRLTPAGAQQAGAWNLYAYSFALNSAKTVKSLTLPNSRNVTVLAVTLRSGNTTAQSVTFNTIPTQTVDTSMTLAATASSSLAPTYASTTTSVCTVSNTTALFLSTGTCTITASQPGSVTYAAATPVSQSFTIQAAGTIAYTTICQAQQNSGLASYCSDQAPGPVSGGYNSLPSWVNLGKTLATITVSDNQVWGIDASAILWYLPNFKASTTNWTQVSTGVLQVSVGHSLVCRINSNTHLLCGLPPATQSATVNWIDAGATSYTQIAVSAGTKLWAVDTSNNLSVITDYTHASTTTTLVAPAVQSVAADGRGLLCQTDLSNNVNCSGWPVLPSTANASGYYNLTNWVSVGKQLQNIAAADNKVYGTDSSGNVWLLPDYTNSATWEEIANGGVNDKMAAASVPSSFQPSAFAPGEVAVMIFMGQSNATGLNSFPTRFLAPSSPNVWGVTNQGWNFLAGNGNGTTPFTSPISSISSIGWTNWLVSPTTMSDMNLGFNTQNDGSAANYAAYQWQAMIDAGAQLPDLYVIHIGWASEGLDANDGGPSTATSWLVHGTSLWQPLLTNSQQPSYALAPFSRRILNLALSNLLASGKTPRIVGLQWNQWEAEAGSGNAASITDAPANYSNLFNGFYTAIGSQFPVQVVKPLSTAYGAPNLSAMQTVFASMASADPTDYSLLDVSQVSSTIFTGGVLGGGDGSVHYNLDTQQWFGNQAINACLVRGNCGTRITTVSTTPTN